MNPNPILVTTQRRGVFFALAGDTDLTAASISGLSRVRMAIRFGTTEGVLQLADSGPTDSSKLGAEAECIILHEVTAVFRVAPEAAAKVWPDLQPASV